MNENRLTFATMEDLAKALDEALQEYQKILLEKHLEFPDQEVEPSVVLTDVDVSELVVAPLNGQSLNRFSRHLERYGLEVSCSLMGTGLPAGSCWVVTVKKPKPLLPTTVSIKTLLAQ